MSAPAQPAAADAERDSNLIIVEDLIKHFPIRAGLLRRQVGAVQAVDGVNFAVKKRETFSIVGESGCGKSTTARLLTRLLEATAGKVTFEGRDTTTPSSRQNVQRLRLGTWAAAAPEPRRIL